MSSVSLAHTLPKGTVLYRSATSKDRLDPSKMDGPVWFHLTHEGDDDTYGTHEAQYTTQKELKLLSLVDRARIKAELESHTNMTTNIIANLMSPDYQYSGSDANLDTHKVLHRLYGKEYDGTHVDEDHLPDELEDDQAGVTEVVIWKEHAAALSSS